MIEMVYVTRSSLVDLRNYRTKKLAKFDRNPTCGRLLNCDIMLLEAGMCVDLLQKTKKMETMKNHC